jgi:hypothetical protein
MTYLNVTTTISAQKASDTTPMIARSPPTPFWAWAVASRRA